MVDIHLLQVVVVEVEALGELFTEIDKSGSSMADGTCRSLSDASAKESKLYLLDATNQLAYYDDMISGTTTT